MSCLENPRDGGAWWAAVYGVAQSRTRLKRLSSSRYDLIAPHMLKGRKKIPEDFVHMKRYKGLNFTRLATKDICILIITEAKQYIDTKGAVCEKRRIKQHK